MKKFLLPVFITGILTLLCSVVYSQAGEWTWMKGDSTSQRYGTYGVKGVPADSNEPAGRYAPAFWTDTAGNFWVYSGDINTDDMWRFDPVTLIWTWMAGNDSLVYPNPIKGHYDPRYSPGLIHYGVFTWVTADNHLWLYGGDYGPGQGPDNGFSSNLWQYNPSINQWAWMGDFRPANYGVKGIGDSTTMPGGRCESNCAWTDDSSNLWLFGGYDFNGLNHNDVWKYNINTGIWTWMSGSSVGNDPGSYGVIGQPSVNNYPSARLSNFFWKDSEGNFWLGGGLQLLTSEFYQDIWKFNPHNLQWTWVKGNQGNDESTVGEYCVADTDNEDGPRYENRAVWKISDCLIVTYSGYKGSTSSGISYDGLDDLWAYRPYENEWILVNSWVPDGDGDGSYGVMGIASPTNYPHPRVGSVGFTDKQNNLWMFGGKDIDYPGGFWPNDVWKYQLDTTCVGSLYCSRSCDLASPTISSHENIFCVGDSGQICAPSGFVSYQWNAGVTGTGNCIEATQAGDYYVTVTDIDGCTAESNHIPISVYPVPSVSIIVEGDTLSSFGETAYQWYFGNTPIPGATSTVYIARQPGNYSVQVTDTNGCQALSNPVNIIINGITNIYDNVQPEIYPNPFNNSIIIHLSDAAMKLEQVEIYDVLGRTVFTKKINETTETTIKLDLNALSEGVYYVRMRINGMDYMKQIVKQ